MKDFKTQTCQFLGKDFDPRDMSIRFDDNGNYLTTDHFMCGQPVKKDTSYCAGHGMIMFRGAGPRHVMRDIPETELMARLFEEAVAELNDEGFFDQLDDSLLT